MSFLLRLAARAAPVSRATPVLMPKNAGLRRAAAPEEEMPEDEAEAQRTVRRVPLRRAEPEEKDETLARQEAEPDEESAAQRASAPTEDESEEEPPARRIARKAEEDDENLRPARPLTSEDMSPENARLPEEVAGEPEPPDLRALRRAALPPEDDKEPGAARAPADLNEEDDANMRPLRRAMGPIAATATAPAAPAMAGTDMAAGIDAAVDVSGDFWRPGLGDAMLGGRDLPTDDRAPPTTPFAPAPAGFARPQVIIDQLDVVIHEPASAPARAARFDAGRALRARYLRRL